MPEYVEPLSSGRIPLIMIAPVWPGGSPVASPDRGSNFSRLPAMCIRGPEVRIVP